MDPTSMDATTDSHRNLRRRTEGRILGGVATGLARYLDMDVAIVRVGMVALCLFAGMAIPLYLAGWLLIPEEGADSALADALSKKVRNCRPADGQPEGVACAQAVSQPGDAIGDAPEPGGDRGMDGVVKPSKPTRAGLTERLATACARRPKRTLALWGIAVVVALVLAGTTLHGLTTSEHVVGATPSSQAEALYNQVIGASAAARRPTDVIVVSSKSTTVDDPGFKALVTRLLDQVKTSPGVTNVGTDLSPRSPLVSSTGHAALIELRAASDADIKPVVHAVQTANGAGGFAVAVTGTHTVGNDFTTLSTSDLHRGELDFGLPIALVILILVFGAVVAGLMPVVIALLSIIVGLGVVSIVSQEFSLSIFILNMMIGMGLALGIDYSLFVISRFREEHGNGLDKEAAIRRTGATASRAVLFSGSTFVVALCAMFLVRTNVLRSLAAGAIIVGAVSVVAALTLLPAILSLMGDRIERFTRTVPGKEPRGRRRRRSEDLEGRDRGGHAPAGDEPCPGRRRDGPGRCPDPGPAHRSERRGHVAEHRAFQAGLSRPAGQLPQAGPEPCRDRRGRGDDRRAR